MISVNNYKLSINIYWNKHRVPILFQCNQERIYVTNKTIFKIYKIRGKLFGFVIVFHHQSSDNIWLFSKFFQGVYSSPRLGHTSFKCFNSERYILMSKYFNELRSDLITPPKWHLVNAFQRMHARKSNFKQLLVVVVSTWIKSSKKKKLKSWLLFLW